MKTYQDLLALGKNEESRKTFVIDAIYEHKCSSAYITAVEAHGYYKGLNPTIMKYEKIIYDLQGIAHNDEWTANHKIASNFFNFAVTQERFFVKITAIRGILQRSSADVANGLFCITKT